MIEQPQIVSAEARQTAIIRFTIPRDEIRHVMGPAIGEVMAAVVAQGIGPAGPVFSYHFRMDPQIFDFEVGVPVTTPVTPVGRVVASHLPATRVARTTYRGPYEGLGAAWGEFNVWVTEQGLAPASTLWECYVAGPESSANPADWRTEFNRPLVA